MSERILKALMQLFAIMARVNLDDKDHPDVIEGIDIVESILRAELSTSSHDFYLDYYREQVRLLHKNRSIKNSEQKRTSVNSVKILKVCHQINKELTRNQKLIVLIRVLEYIKANGEVQTQELDFATTVSGAFNIPDFTYDLFAQFVFEDDLAKLEDPSFLFICDAKRRLKKSKTIILRNLDQPMVVFRLEKENVLFVKYYGSDELIFNGQTINSARSLVFSSGCALRTNKSSTVYYSDVQNGYIQDNLLQRISFQVSDLSYQFDPKSQAIHALNLTAESGTLYGIMGGSGTGKSTLLNILNGSLPPTTGSILINDIDLYNEHSTLDGIIGHISQDDLLIEELTVFQNLYFNARLCYSGLSRAELKRRTITILDSVGLWEVRNLKVGSPLKKTISGGQRKRLNIAFELIREPSILFVDEPTSGLSSRDSENIMSLLKELTLKGKLIFVVIHQPSSDIYKMFDQMLILDQGGYPVFDGNPIDAIVHFKSHANHVNADDRECHVCGNVNPELLFNIIESKVIDEFGHVTSNRKVNSNEWNAIYEKDIAPPIISTNKEKLTRTYLKPKIYEQLSVYFKRDILSKITNLQYVLLNVLEAPVLAFVLAYFLKYFDVSNTESMELTYSLYHNENLPQYLFIGVIVALFLGLTVAAEEIIKDRNLLKREQFLGLSRTAYLFSKIGIMFLISGIQTFLFVWVGNTIMELNNLLLTHWLILFSAACFSNLLGLIISSTFNSAKVIYITVPLLIIPQLLFSGVIVKFDKLNPIFSSQKSVPWIGNIMTSRWAYEGMMVSTKNSSLETIKLYDWNKLKLESAWKRDFWIPELSKQIQIIRDNAEDQSLVARAKDILKNELFKESELWGNLACRNCAIIDTSKQKATLEYIERFLVKIKSQYQIQFENSTDSIDNYVRTVGDKVFAQRQLRLGNDAVNDVVTNSRELNGLVIEKGELIQKTSPYYQNQTNISFLEAPFYVRNKSFFGKTVSTISANLLVIWVFNIGLYFILYSNIFYTLMNLKKPKS